MDNASFNNTDKTRDAPMAIFKRDISEKRIQDHSLILLLSAEIHMPVSTGNETPLRLIP